MGKRRLEGDFYFIPSDEILRSILPNDFNNGVLVDLGDAEKDRNFTYGQLSKKYPVIYPWEILEEVASKLTEIDRRSPKSKRPK